jgi:hypothetical protein
VSGAHRPEQHCASVPHVAPIDEQRWAEGRQSPASHTPEQQSALRVQPAPSRPHSDWQTRSPEAFGEHCPPQHSAGAEQSAPAGKHAAAASTLTQRSMFAISPDWQIAPPVQQLEAAGSQSSPG